MHPDPYEPDDLIQKVLAAAFEVANTLGSGFLEKVYERVLLYELTLRNIPAQAQASFPVHYKGAYAGEYYADILIEETLVLELKTVDHLAPEHTAQCINYLRASGKKLALLINFQKPKLEWKRIILTNPHPQP
jgi:GxxExxY protein